MEQHALACSRLCMSASSAAVRQMACSSSPARHSARAAQQPLSFAEEQAASALSLMEQRDIAAALRLSLHDDWDSDEEKGYDPAEQAVADDEQEEEEESEEMAAAEEEAEWKSELHDVELPLPRLRHARQLLPPADSTPLQLLQLFLPHSLMAEFAQHTNAAAPHDWRQTTAQEVYAFIGAQLFMGIDRLPHREMYWSAEFGHPLITTLFSRDRFKQLLSYFSVVAPDPAAAVRDPLPYVRALAVKLNAAFAAHFTPAEHLTLDEAMCAYKGRAAIKQYIPSKPHKWGYKIYCLASEDYLLHFEVYEGKEEKRSEEGATYDTVLRMTKDYQQQQLVLFTDNWFTSPTLASALAERGIRLCGSVNRRRKGMPAIPSEQVDTLRRGEWLQRQKGDMTVAVWKDQRTMWMLYNHCSPRETASLDRWSEAGNKVSIGCPRAIRDYFYGARSVDVLSQLHYAYLLGRKARRCWPRLAWWLLDMCIINAFKLWSIGQHHVSQLRFREELMHELLQQLPSEQKPRAHGAALKPAHALASEHFSIHSDNKRDCAVCSQQPNKRKETRFVCVACSVHLCIGDCFAQYHSNV
jgi:hypothetical protein